MSIFERLESMRDLVRAHIWSELEARAAADYRALDAPRADSIANLELRAYQRRLEEGLQVAANRAAEGFRAVYWEFDPDNSWSSAFFVCRAYMPEAFGDDDWASEFDDQRVVPGPDEPSLARHFASSWDATPEAASRNAYLIARTLATFGRAADSTWSLSIPLCAGHHDQDVVFRVTSAA